MLARTRVHWFHQQTVRPSLRFPKVKDFGLMPESIEQTGGYRRYSEQTPFVQREIPRGTIMWWSGSIASIPTTYRLCDGTRTTPDLRDKFIVGAGDTYSVDDTGGQLMHAHDFTSNIHTHTLPVFELISDGTDYSWLLATRQVIGTTDSFSSLPGHHTLVLVMYDGRPI